MLAWCSPARPVWRLVATGSSLAVMHCNGSLLVLYCCLRRVSPGTCRGREAASAPICHRARLKIGCAHKVCVR